MAYNKEFSKARYADLMPILDKVLTLEPGKHITLHCPEKSPHTVGQKIREFLKLASKAMPDAKIDRRSLPVTVDAANRTVTITKREPVKYGAVIIEES